MGRRPTSAKPDGDPGTPVVAALPEGEAAVAALREIADLNQRVHRAHEMYTTAALETKDRRERWQALAEQLQTLIAVKTTAPALPLFDAEAREADQQRMVQEAVPMAAPEDPSPPPDPGLPDDLVF